MDKNNLELYCINSDMYPVLKLDPSDFPKDIWGNIDKMSKSDYMDHYSHGNPYIIVTKDFLSKIYFDAERFLRV